MKLFFLCYLLLMLNSVSATENLGAQEIISKLDEALIIRDGLTHAKLKIKIGNFEKKTWDIKFFKRKKNLLIHFIEPNRLIVAKLFSIENGEKIIFYRALSGKFYQIEEAEKMEFMFHTSFSFLDLAFKPFEANFITEEISKPDSHEEKDRSLLLKPISLPNYKSILLKMDQNYTPIKLEYKDSQDLFLKTLKFRFGNIATKGETIYGLKKLEMIKAETSETSILEFILWDNLVQPDDIFYEWKSIFER
jgi:hypothetical protein